jgi:hypothetical protein
MQCKGVSYATASHLHKDQQQHQQEPTKVQPRSQASRRSLLLRCIILYATLSHDLVQSPVRAWLQLTIDGYSAPITAGNFVANVLDGRYDGRQVVACGKI